MEYDTYSADAVQLAVDLANLPAEREATQRFVDLHREWIGGPARLSDAEVAAIAALSQRLREVAEAPTDAHIAVRLNGVLRDCSPEPRLTDHDGTLHLHYSSSGAPVVTRLGATAAMGLAQLLCRYGRERLGICAAGECTAVFIDTSRNCSRRYCSQACASRTTVSAYRARQRAART